MFRDRPMNGPLGPGARIPGHPALQPRRRPSRGEDRLQRRPGDAGPRLPQRRGHSVPVRTGRPRGPGRPRRRRPADDGLVPDPRRAWGASIPSQSRRLAPDFFFHPQIYRQIGRDGAPAAGDVHGRVHARARVPGRRRRTITVPKAKTHRESFRAQAVGEPGEDGLVLGRPPRPRRRLRPLREPDRGGPARGHDAAHPGRGPRRRLRA